MSIRERILRSIERKPLYRIAVALEHMEAIK